MYPEILDEVVNETYLCSPLLFIIVVPFRFAPFWVYAKGPAFLPLLGATVGTGFLESRVERQGLFLNVSDILKTAHSELWLHFRKQQEIASGQIRRARGWGT